MTEKKETKKTAKYEPRLKSLYKSKVIESLKKDLGVKNVMSVPKVEKVIISMSVNEAKENVALLDIAKKDLTSISGQAAQTRKAKKSISNFKVREGMPLGVIVTLRGNRMYEFLDRFISIACPRIRDFQGFNNKSFDGRGNLNLGIKDHYIFPEVNVDKSPKSRGLNITFVTTTTEDDASRKLLTYMGIPFRKKGAK
ncbi:MAG: 50S ribosomal protein L5 [Elusimicrobiaceae bacterium]|jgi:large subunit ribosomal protein L5|nr:50S ribosomal protein L5 [Elusimicrobiaceae bacterium]MBT3955241.1 50S ribosomal protein L5 [Elusimicrobiaceae bacterium]MBT4007711.1 50S ribosomal protein L5 [Elusimicrobiaceae bacterium]MBT4402401.1 50S ribosomal protein L5 [Elusimicrobiaceae bacterium]MBT4440396.1 50S ribosomal protein L5 [Elusimicrobiaceae bacterium]